MSAVVLVGSSGSSIIGFLSTRRGLMALVAGAVGGLAAQQLGLDPRGAVLTSAVVGGAIAGALLTPDSPG